MKDVVEFLEIKRVPGALTSALGRCLWRFNSPEYPTVHHRLAKCITAYDQGGSDMLQQVAKDMGLDTRPQRSPPPTGATNATYYG